MIYTKLLSTASALLAVALFSSSSQAATVNSLSSSATGLSNTIGSISGAGSSEIEVTKTFEAAGNAPTWQANITGGDGETVQVTETISNDIYNSGLPQDFLDYQIGFSFITTQTGAVSIVHISNNIFATVTPNSLGIDLTGGTALNPDYSNFFSNPFSVPLTLVFDIVISGAACDAGCDVFLSQATTTTVASGAPVPVPATIALFGLALAGMSATRRKAK